jgi:chromosome segregation ATPase
MKLKVISIYRALTNEVSKIKNEKQSLEIQIDELTKKAYELKEKAEKDIKSLTESHTRDLETLSKDKSEADKKLEDKIKELHSLTESYKHKETELTEVKEKLESLQTEKATHAEEIAKLSQHHQTELDAINQTIAAKDEEVKQLTDKEALHDAKIKQLESQIESLKQEAGAHASNASEVGGLKQQLEELRKSQEESTISIEGYQADIKKKDEEIKDHAQTIEDLKNEIAEFKDKLKLGQDELSEARNKLQELTAERDALRSKADSNTDVEKEHKDQLHELEVKCAEAENKLSASETQALQLNDEVRDLNQKLKEIKTENEELKKKIAEQDEQLKEVADNLQLSIESKDKEIEKLASKLELEKSSLEEIQSTLQKISEERDSLKSQVGNTEAEDKLKIQVQELQDKLSATEDKLTEAELQSSSLKAKVDEAAEELSKANIERNAMKSKLEDVEKQLEEVNNHVKQLQSKEKEIPVSEETTLKAPIETGEISAKQISDAKPEQSEVSPRDDADLATSLRLQKQKLEDEHSALNEEINSRPGKKKKGKPSDDEKKTLDRLKTEIEEIEKQLTILVEQERKPSIEILPPEDQKETNLPQDGKPPAEVVDAQMVEEKLEEEIKDKDEVLRKWRLYLEKVFSHISLLDAEMKERNHDLELIAEQVANTEKLKDCQQAIISVLKRTIAGIVRIGVDAGVKTEHEIEEIAKDIRAIRESSSSKKESKSSSAREIMIHETKPEVIIHPADPSPDDNTRISSDTIEAEKTRLEDMKQSLDSASSSFDKLKYEMLRARLLEEKIGDHMALLVNSIKEYSNKLVEVKHNIKEDEEAVKHLTEAKKALSEILNIGNEDLKDISKDLITNLPPTEKKDEQDHSHVDTPATSAHENKHAIHQGSHATLSPAPPEDLVEKMNEKLEQVERERAQQEDLVSTKKLELEKVEKQIALVEGQISDFSKHLTEKNKTIDDRQKEIAEKEKELEKVEKQIASVEGQISDFSKHLTEKNKTIDDRQKEIAEKEKELEKVEKQIASVEGQISDFLKHLTEKNKTIDDRQNEIAEKEKELERIKAELEKKTAEAAHLETTQKDVTSKLDAVKEKAAEVHHEDHHQFANESESRHDTTGSSPKKSFSRQQTVKEEHVALTITPSPDNPQDDVVPVDPKIIEDLIARIKTDIDKQHKQAEDYHKLKADYDKLLLTHDKLLENIAKHKADFDEKTEQIKALHVTIEQDHGNLKIRDELAAHLKACIETAKKLKDTSAAVATFETVDTNLAEQRTSIERIKVLEEELEQNNQEVALFLNHLGDEIRKLVFVAQQGSIGQIKAILKIEQLPDVHISDEYLQKCKDIETNLGNNLEELENMWSKASSNSDRQQDMMQYIEKVVDLESDNLKNLDSLLDNIYASMTTRRSADQSPESTKFSTTK